MPRDEELPIIRTFYDFVLWLNPKIAKFPGDQRFVLGERMERQLYEVLENLIRAKYTRSRRAILDQVNLDLEIPRFQIRLAKDMRFLSLKSYGMAAEGLTDSRVGDGLRLLGYRVWPDHRFLDRRGLSRFGRRLRTYQRLYRAGLLSAQSLTPRIRAWLGHAGHADTWRFTNVRTRTG